jgi:FtsZ-binding cell division protein ZapB
MTELQKVATLLKTAAETIKSLENEVSELKANSNTSSTSSAEEFGIGTVVSQDDYNYKTNPKDKFDEFFS